MPGYSFRKRERLSGRKDISSLFQSGMVVHTPPLKVFFEVTRDMPYQAQVAIAVPKRLHKRAVDRNLLKRRIREAYRRNKTELHRQLEKSGIQISMIIRYQKEEIFTYNLIENAVKQAFALVVQKLNNNSSQSP
jgi:ribonuclease P protein component